MRRLVGGRHPKTIIPTLTVGGIDLAQRFDHSAFSLVTVTMMPDGPLYKLRFMERLPVGLPYHQQVGHFADRLARYGERLETPGRINLDISGVGRPVGEMLAERVDGNRWALQFCTIAAGWKVTPPGPLPPLRWPFLGPSGIPPRPDPFRSSWRVPASMPATPHERVIGKSHLVITLQKIVQQHRLEAARRARRYLAPLVDELSRSGVRWSRMVRSVPGLAAVPMTTWW
jgi:hypothetical protein